MQTMQMPTPRMQAKGAAIDKRPIAGPNTSNTTCGLGS
jgi:hypothetical protein